MNDLISREDTLERLRSIPADLGRRELDDAIKAVKNMPSEGKAASTITIELKPEQIKKYVEQAITDMIPSEQQWIPCSERMPDEELYVLACQEETGFTEIGRLHTEKLGEDTVVVCQCDDRDEVRYIQAWMPLPKPYKGDDDG